MSEFLIRNLILTISAAWIYLAAATVSAQDLVVCYNFACKTQQSIQVTKEEWRSVIGWFYPKASNAVEEREKIKKALGWLEVIVGRHTPTFRDKGLNLEKNPEFPGQLDCIDESINVNYYMKIFEEQGHMQYHRVIDRAYRRAGFDSHWAGQIQESATGERFVVDSWFQDNGMLPYIARSLEWENLSRLRLRQFGLSLGD